MSTLSSTSTRAEVLAAYADNASYEEDASIAKAQAFITAVRILLSPKHLVQRVAHGGRSAEEVELDLALLREELKAAQGWLAGALAADSGAVIHADVTDFRV
jgi:hypothetical protein